MNAIRTLRLSARLLLTAVALTLAMTVSLVASATPASARSISRAAQPAAANSGPCGAIYLVVLIAGGCVAFTSRRVRTNKFD